MRLHKLFGRFEFGVAYNVLVSNINGGKGSWTGSDRFFFSFLQVASTVNFDHVSISWLLYLVFHTVGGGGVVCQG